MAAPVELVVVPDARAAAETAARLLGGVVEEGGAIAVAGGSTPRLAYELAAAAHLDWSGVDLWFGDERCVAPDDPLSNLQLVREALLDRVDVLPIVHPVETDRPAAAAAAAYDTALRGVRLDLVLLGLGTDGHTASLFPGAPALQVRDRLAVAAEPGLEPFVERVTLTIPALEASAQVVFLVVGEEKADAVKRAFGGERSSETPASLVRSRSGATTVILDRAASSSLGA